MISCLILLASPLAPPCGPTLYLQEAAAEQAADSLRQELEEARALVAAKDGAGAEARVLQMLTDHEGSVVLLRHLPAVEDVLIESLYLQDLAARAAALGKSEVPAIPFDAEILSYKAKTGVYKLRWSGEQLADLPMEDTDLEIPIALDGKFKVSIELAPYPERGQIEIEILNAAGRSFEVECGSDSAGLNMMVAKVYRNQGDQQELLIRSDKKLPQPGEDTTISLSGLGGSMQVYSGRTKILKFKGDKTEIGNAIFHGVAAESLVAIEYEGKLDAEALVARLQEVAARNRLRFRRAVDLSAVVPAWVRPYLGETTADFAEASPPGGEPQGDVAIAWQKTQEGIAYIRREGIPIEALSWLQDSAPTGLPESLREYASMQVAFEGGYWDYAVGHAGNVLRIVPGHVPTQRVQLAALARNGDGDRAWEVAKEIYAAHPESQAPILQATHLLMSLDMVDDLRFFLMEEKGFPEDLKARCDSLLLRRQGPSGDAYREVTERLLILTTDLPEEEANRVATWATRTVGRAVGFLPDNTISPKEKLRIFLFVDRWDYEEFAAEILSSSHPSASGFFSPEFDAVVAWKNPDQQAFEQSLRRELMIHVGKRIHPEYPIWASVGLAEIVGDSSINPGKEIEQLSPRAAKLYLTARADGFLKFTTMLSLGGPGFYALESERSMEAQAWVASLILVVMSDAVGQDILDLMIDGLRSGKTWAETVDSIFSGYDSTGDFDAAFRYIARSIGRLLP